MRTWQQEVKLDLRRSVSGCRSITLSNVPLPANPNLITATCAAGADNFVNFGEGRVTKLQVVVESALQN